jgi:hypothetical protein
MISGENALRDSDVKKVELNSVSATRTETAEDVVINPELTGSQKKDLKRVFKKHESMLTDVPGSVDIQTHSVKLTGDKVVNVKQYPLPFQSEKVVCEEVEKMLQLGVIEESVSPYSSPVVLVKKKDGSIRFCIDFRELNKVTEFDAEPIPDVETLFTSLRNKTFFTKVDLAKGYWQIPMAAEDKEKTAFRTPMGLFQFVRMPFGMSTAPSSFARMMRKMNLGRFEAVTFFDDILIATETWDAHIKSLDGLLTELTAHGLTARPSKVEAGFKRIQFLGHMVGGGEMRPLEGKVSKILRLAVPTTKKQVRALLGMVGFYRRYIPLYSDITAPLVDLTKKKQPNRVRWSEECQQAFEKIKSVLSSQPEVMLPDFERPFTVRSDASSTGIGAVLIQHDDCGRPHPVLFASRRLLDRETRYSTVERECLGLVWAVDKFHRYLFGRHFFVETDHKPLTYLTKSNTSNGRLMRWALSLQDYSFTVTPIPGARNHEADVLSRLTL